MSEKLFLNKCEMENCGIQFYASLK
jgi:hypothetical protein